MPSSPGGLHACCLDRLSTRAQAPRRVSLFNLSLLLTPLLVVLLRPTFGSGFAVVAPSTKTWSLPRWWGGSSTSVSMHQRSRSSAAQFQHRNQHLLRLPAATAAGAATRGNSKVLVFRESETRRYALPDEMLEGVAAALTPPEAEVRSISQSGSSLCQQVLCRVTRVY